MSIASEVAGDLRELAPFLGTQEARLVRRAATVLDVQADMLALVDLHTLAEIAALAGEVSR